METADRTEWQLTQAYHRPEQSASPLKYLNRATVLEGARLPESLANAGRPLIRARHALPLNSAVALSATAYRESEPDGTPIKWANGPAALGDPRPLALMTNIAVPSIAAPTSLPDNVVADRVETG